VRHEGACGPGPIPSFSFGLSRTLALAGVATLDGADSHKVGSWYFGEPEGMDVLETCWSLLFLARATDGAVKKAVIPARP